VEKEKGKKNRERSKDRERTKGLGAVISCTQKARSLNPNALWLLA